MGDHQAMARRLNPIPPTPLREDETMNFTLFTDAQLEAAIARHEADFQKSADEGYLSMATSAHASAEPIRAELAQRANAAELSQAT